MGYAYNSKTLITEVSFDDITVQNEIERVNTFYEETDVLKKEWIKLYGGFQNVLGKKQIENFGYYKTGYGKLVQTQELVPEGRLETDLENIDSLMQYCLNTGREAYYITSILPIVDEADIPIGVTDYSHENAERLLSELDTRDYSIIDLRNAEQINQIEKENLFYKTDHHWALGTSFAAFHEILWRVEKDLGWKLDPSGNITSLEAYEKYVQEDAFLGSYGVKVGELYAGKDDFVIYVPKFDTDLEFGLYRNHNLLLEAKGDFFESFINSELLEDEDYNNKYNVFQYGSSAESRIVNHLAENDKKLLVIGHSYGRPLTMYLSLCFGETRYLDPQVNRYTDSYVEYIDNYDPDLVLVLVEFEGEWLTNVNMGE